MSKLPFPRIVWWVGIFIVASILIGACDTYVVYRLRNQQQPGGAASQQPVKVQ
jgi:hypothetical protein